MSAKPLERATLLNNHLQQNGHVGGGAGPAVGHNS